MNGFLQNFGQQIKYILDMRITDILDILIVAYVIYLLSNLIRRTRTYTVFQGILILLGILGLSNILRLRTVNFILRNTMELGLLAGDSVMPAAAPALAAICWTDAPITAAGAENDRTRVTYERTLCQRRLTVDTWLENGLPISAQVCYNQQCILKLEVSEFYMK